MTAEHGSEHPAPQPDWQDSRQWVEGTDWSDWRSWLRRIAAADWSAAPWPGTPWEQEAGTRPILLPLRAFAEDEPGDQIAAHLRAAWPGLRRWWQGGTNARPSADQARARLEQHMPELVPTWRRLADLAAADRHARRRSRRRSGAGSVEPSPFLTGCSQAAVLPGGPALVRNYDWDYRLFDAVVARTSFAGRRVLGMLDCLWGCWTESTTPGWPSR